VSIFQQVKGTKKEKTNVRIFHDSLFFSIVSLQENIFTRLAVIVRL